ncbi:DUF726 domain protein [Phyllosticta capitalensis]|uniref:DUF726 domain protein n=1 Tax=Phyllosticta capitalensis TaxID=121624 RepID=A0ABR1Z576_9PEZI
MLKLPALLRSASRARSGAAKALPPSLCASLNRRSSSNNAIGDIDELLAKPTWSVQSLLPTDSQTADAPTVTPEQLRHLLRLSALPEPKDAAEEQSMLATLRSQLHFVRAIQEIDTEGVSPLRAIRDETTPAEKESEIGLHSGAIKEALAQEEVKGEHYKRVITKERKEDDVTKRAEDWDVLGYAEKKAGKYFVVENGNAQN